MLQVTYNQQDLNLLEAADIAEQNEKYNHAYYRDDDNCGTPGCLLGGYAIVHRWEWTEATPALGLAVDIPHLPRKSIEESAKEEFGLTENECYHLFFNPRGCGGAGRDGKKAAAYVRKFVQNRALARLTV